MPILAADAASVLVLLSSGAVNGAVRVLPLKADAIWTSPLARNSSLTEKIYICVCVCACIFIHAHIYTCTHIYTCIQLY